MTSFIQDLKRRNVFKVAAAYAIIAWLLLQIAGLLFPTFGAPVWVMPVFTMLILLGFPIALVLAWALELTADGVRRTSSVEAVDDAPQPAGARMNVAIIGLLAFAAIFMFVDNYVLEDAPEPAGDAAAAAPAPVQTGIEQPANPTPSPVDGAGDAAAASSPLPNSIAVLPLESLSQDAAEAYFSAQMHVELISRLRKLGSLNVIAREAVMRYATDRPPLEQIAGGANVESLVIAAASHANGRVRVDVELVDPMTGLSLFNESYQRELSDIFEVQADIATRLAAALDAELSTAAQERIETPPTNSEAAYLLYLRARETRDLAEAIELLDRATIIDPEFAAAYATKGGMENTSLLPQNAGRSLIEDPAERATISERSFANITHAIELDPTLADAWLGLGVWHILRWQLEEAGMAYQRAYELDPDHPQIASNYALWLRWTNRPREALPITERSVELSPNVAAPYASLAGILFVLEDYRAALPICTRGRQVAPSVVNLIMLCAAVEAQADLPPETAAASLRLAEDIAPTGALTGWWATLIRVYLDIGMPDEAERIYRRFLQQDSVAPFSDATWASVHLARGEADRTFARLEAAIVRAENARASGIDVDPGYFNLIVLFENTNGDALLEEPRFVELRQRLSPNRSI